MIRKVAAIVALAICGAALLPFENKLSEEQKAANLRKTDLNLDLREKVGQMGFLAALSGFRSPVAALLWIQAQIAWERTEWRRMAGLFDMVTTLQPRSTLYWDMAAWHMAYNASVAALEDKNQPNEAVRIKNQRQFIALGRNILENGVRNNPESALLLTNLGVLLRDKVEDHCAAAQAFLKASRLPDSLLFVERAAGYEMAKCPGHEREAYDLLLKLYNKGESERKPSVITTLKELEKKLDVPADQRIKSDAP